MLDKEFELKMGDLVHTPNNTCIVLAHTSWGGMTLRDTYMETNFLPSRTLVSRDWIRLLDEYYGRSHWTLFRRISPAEWISLPRPMEV